MRKLAHVLFFTIITILTVHHVNFVSATEEAKNDLVKSIDELKKALEKEPSNIDVHYYLGLAYNDRGMISEAIADLPLARSCATSLVCTTASFDERVPILTE